MNPINQNLPQDPQNAFEVFQLIAPQIRRRQVYCGRRWDVNSEESAEVLNLPEFQSHDFVGWYGFIPEVLRRLPDWPALPPHVTVPYVVAQYRTFVCKWPHPYRVSYMVPETGGWKEMTSILAESAEQWTQIVADFDLYSLLYPLSIGLCIQI